MYTITIVRDTWLKQSPVQGSQLTDSQKRLVAAGDTFEVPEYAIAANKHIEMRSDGCFRYLFQEHVTIANNTPTPVEYVGLTELKGGRRSTCTVEDGFVQSALSDSDIQKLSSEFGLSVAIIKAVMEVEAAGSGFLLNEPSPSRPKILFEAHWFYKLTPHPVSRTRPDLSSRTWNRSLYKGGSAEWDRLMDAIAFDEIQALKSTSWGLGQVMGFNYMVAGCDSIEEFVLQSFTSEYYQARHMLSFINNNSLLDDLKRLDWSSFAYGYNGPGYRANRYDKKLASAYAKYR